MTKASILSYLSNTVNVLANISHAINQLTEKTIPQASSNFDQITKDINNTTDELKNTLNNINVMCSTITGNPQALTDIIQRIDFIKEYLFIKFHYHNIPEISKIKEISITNIVQESQFPLREISNNTIDITHDEFSDFINDIHTEIETLLLLIKINANSLSGHFPDHFEDIRESYTTCYTELESFSSLKHGIHYVHNLNDLLTKANAPLIILQNKHFDMLAQTQKSAINTMQNANHTLPGSKTKFWALCAIGIILSIISACILYIENRDCGILCKLSYTNVKFIIASTCCLISIIPLLLATRSNAQTSKNTSADNIIKFTCMFLPLLGTIIAFITLLVRIFASNQINICSLQYQGFPLESFSSLIGCGTAIITILIIAIYYAASYFYKTYLQSKEKFYIINEQQHILKLPKINIQAERNTDVEIQNIEPQNKPDIIKPEEEIWYDTQEEDFIENVHNGSKNSIEEESSLQGKSPSSTLTAPIVAAYNYIYSWLSPPPSS